jgi:hypothetical protein
LGTTVYLHLITYTVCINGAAHRFIDSGYRPREAEALSLNALSLFTVHTDLEDST